jgi:hypothetical protein
MNTDIAWAAGLFDGEGHITIQKSKPYAARGERSYKYSLIINLGMTHHATVRKFAEIVGAGRLGCLRQRNPEHACMLRWQTERRNASAILKIMLPYLKTKRVEALLALQFEDCQAAVSAPVFGTPSDLTAKRENFYLLLREAKNAYKHRESHV